MSSLLYPSLTTGRSDGAEIGRQCVRMVFERLKDPERPQQILNLPTKLIVRQSTGVNPEVITLEQQVNARYNNG
jgi:DNA-binding LacI/PurR family transcriptional regulator